MVDNESFITEDFSSYFAGSFCSTFTFLCHAVVGKVRARGFTVHARWIQVNEKRCQHGKTTQLSIVTDCRVSVVVIIATTASAARPYRSCCLFASDARDSAYRCHHYDGYHYHSVGWLAVC